MLSLKQIKQIILEGESPSLTCKATHQLTLLSTNVRLMSYLSGIYGKLCFSCIWGRGAE